MPVFKSTKLTLTRVLQAAHTAFPSLPRRPKRAGKRGRRQAQLSKGAAVYVPYGAAHHQEMAPKRLHEKNPDSFQTHPFRAFLHSSALQGFASCSHDQFIAWLLFTFGNRATEDRLAPSQYISVSHPSLRQSPKVVGNQHISMREWGELGWQVP